MLIAGTASATVWSAVSQMMRGVHPIANQVQGSHNGGKNAEAAKTRPSYLNWAFAGDFKCTHREAGFTEPNEKPLKIFLRIGVVVEILCGGEE